MTRGIAVVTALCSALFALRAQAQARLPSWAQEPLSLARCLELAQHEAVSEQALRSRVETAAALLQRAKVVPNPVLSYTAQDFGATAGGPLLLHQETLSFPPFYAITRAQEAKVAHANLTQVTATADEDRLRLRLAAGRVFHDAQFFSRLAVIERQAVADAAALLEKTQRRVAHGDAGTIEVVRAQAELEDARRGAEQAERRRELERLSLSVLLGAEPPFPVLLADHELEPDAERVAAALKAIEAETTDGLFRRAESTRPELVAARARLLREEEQLRLEARRVIPLSDLQLAIGSRQSAIGVTGVVTLSMPLPLFDHNAGPRIAARAQVAMAQAGLLTQRRQIALEIATARYEWQASREALVQQVRPLYLLRAQVAAATQRQFAEGLLSLFEAAQSLRDVIAARRALAQAEREVAQSGLRLRELLGLGSSP